MDNAVKESNSMMKTILAGLSMTIDQNDDLIPAPMETEDELQEMEQKLKNQTYRKKMVNVFVKSVE